MTVHAPVRPQWICVVDHESWPCHPAQAGLTETIASEALVGRLLWVMATASVDLNVGSAKLYRRFVGWTLPEETTCRVCGRGGHDLLPGLPPRLFPCNGQVLAPLRLPKGDPQQAAVADLSHPLSTCDSHH